MPRYSTKDLPEAGRRAETLRKTVSFEGASRESFSEIASSSGLRSRSSSPESRKSASDIGKDSSTSMSVFMGSISEGDDVFATNDSFNTYDDGVVCKAEANVDLIIRHPPEIDPQVLYSPKACVFVANLSSGYDDETLKNEVTRIFSEYGEVYTKIKRDKRRMPFAFCQFTNIADAKFALDHGAERFILGRYCRAEEARANRTFIVYKRSGERTRLNEAHALLQHYGSISKVENLDQHTQVTMNLPLSVVVVFEMFDARRDVLKSTSRHPVFVVIPHDAAHEQQLLDAAMNNSNAVERYCKDARSIYVGNLPPCVNEDLIHLLVAPYGEVIEIQIKQNTLPNGNVVNFAFVEFDNNETPELAVNHCNGREVQGYLIRVQKKKLKVPTTPHRILPAGVVASSRSLGRSDSFHYRGPSTSHSSVSRHPRQQSTVDPWATSSRALTLQAQAGPSTGNGYLMDTPSEAASQSLVRAYPQTGGTRAYPQIGGTSVYPYAGSTQAYPGPSGSQTYTQPPPTQGSSDSCFRSLP
ncbi:hypothetical protein G7Z17_g12777 [Cylindrodendrum hubeiense]|uniref:RRM domain-containing protein n=1 Tax=Cylindrodendrum hubeiense TaxID=595255 RepID=A0A9P5H087_9HYPO|nr:hypothetical protein G7Z17_g12777 [Cylindrodendrum hubeiense]